MLPSLITIDVIIEDSKTKALYDSGANISIISLHFLKTLKHRLYAPKSLIYSTMSGEDKVCGVTYLNTKIFNISKRVRYFVIDKRNYKYDLLLGLDLIRDFRLCQNSELQVFQASERNINGINKVITNTIVLHNNNMNENAKINEDITNTTVLHNKKNNESEIMIKWSEHIPVDKFNEKTLHLDANQRNKISELINRNASVFAKGQFDVGKVKGYEAHIQLMEDSYISKKPYRCSLDDGKEIERQVAELLKHGMIEESCSPFAAPVTLAFKKTGEGGVKEKTRMCIDFRGLNKILTPETYPFPLIDDIILKTRNCEWFSAFDINSAFWSIPICKKDRYKTGFVTQNGHWQWISMPFGLKNSPAIFQRILSGIIRRNKLSDFCVNYIDDVLIFSRTFEEHLQHLELLICAIYNEGFRFKFVKCTFATHSVQYLGHIIGRNSVRPLNDNLVSIRDFPTPKNRKNIRQFLGKVNFYHKFIENAATVLEEFHRLLRKDVPFKWTESCQDAFQKIKDYLTSSPVLAVFDRELPITIYTDASGVGIGAVLKQEQTDGVEKPVAFFSKKLNEHQRKQKAIYIEGLAVRESVKFWRYWLLGRHFKVVTDHKPLENLNLKSRTDEELGDLANYLLQYDFEIVYRPGTKNSEADCLSRNPVLNSDFGNDVPDILPVINLLEISDIKKSQIKLERSSLDIDFHGILVREYKGNKRILLDVSCGKQLIEKVHHRYGHIGVKHVYAILGRHYTFERMFPSIREYCASCITCLKNKTRTKKVNGLLGLLGPAKEPYEIMSLDTIGGFGGARSMKRYLHLLVDHFTRFAFVLTSKTQNASDFVKLINSVQKENKIGILLTDQYGGLGASEFENYLKKEKITHLFTALDTPSSNGINERLNQTLTNRIRCRINENNNNTLWTTIAHQCVEEYNATLHSVTQFAPSYLLYGIPNDIVPELFLNTSDLLADRRMAYNNILKNHEENKRRFDLKRVDTVFNVGDKVFVENGNKLNRHKLDEIRKGPFPIIRKLGNSVYEIDVGYKSCSKRLYHASKIVKIEVGDTSDSG